MIQGKLGSLVGRSSGYIESLPAPVRRRVAGLKGVQKEHSKLEAEFQEEVLQLEKKYFAKFTPLYEKRAKIVNGAAEPTDAEVKDGEDDEEKDVTKPETENTVKQEESSETVSGIPEFWLSAMKNQVSLAEMITDRDEAALKHLTDVRMEYLDKPGFRLIFEFGENEFFTNKIITKTYFYQNDSGYGGDFIYDHAEGHEIDWKPGKDLTVRIESKKQRNKSEFFCARYDIRELKLLQIQSKLGLSRRPSRQSLFLTFLIHLRLLGLMIIPMTARQILRNVLSLTISWVKISRRS